MYKNDYEDRFLEQEIVINEELANKLNGRCFLDTDMPERVEGFKFVKTKTGIDCIYIGAWYCGTYSHVCHEDYGTYKVKDTYFGTDIASIETNFYLIKEISEEVFNKMISIVSEQDNIVTKLKSDFEEKQREIFKEIIIQ